jgi:hypothetical protein
MGEPITVGGGGGLVERLADYDIDLEFKETKFVNDGDDNFVYADHKIAGLQLLDYGGTLIADLTKLLPADGECNIVLKFNHGYERIYIKSKPLTISFDSDLWPTANGKRKRRTRHDRMVVDFGRGRWQGLEIATPSGGFKIKVESD